MIAACGAAACIAALNACGGESAADSGVQPRDPARLWADVPDALLAEPTSADRAAAVALGRQVWIDNACASCHLDTSDETLGPSLNNSLGTTVEFVNGATAARTPAYMYHAIVAPDEALVNGYGATMISYDYLGEDNVIALVRYIESLSETDADSATPDVPPPGEPDADGSASDQPAPGGDQ
jgi:hypothetical protein